MALEEEAMSPVLAGLNIPVTELGWLMALGFLGGILIVLAVVLAWRRPGRKGGMT